MDTPGQTSRAETVTAELLAIPGGPFSMDSERSLGAGDPSIKQRHDGRRARRMLALPPLNPPTARTRGER